MGKKMAEILDFSFISLNDLLPEKQNKRKIMIFDTFIYFDIFLYLYIAFMNKIYKK